MVRPPGWPRGVPFRSFFQHHMNIGSSNPKRTNPRLPRTFLPGPVPQFCVHKKGTVGKINLRIGLFKINAGGNFFVMQGQCRFN